MDLKLFTLLPLILCAFANEALAQDNWKLSSAITSMTGTYADSFVMRDQHGSGLRLNAKYQQSWGFSAGVQSTRIYMKPYAPSATQDQDNWLVSGYMYVPSSISAGRWTFQLDGHQIHNDAKVGNSDGVHVIAPQVTWQSYTLPFKLDMGVASSSYSNVATIHQVSAGIALGFFENKNWLQIRGYAINNLDPLYAMGNTHTRATDIKLTQIFPDIAPWLPNSITLGIERGRKIYVVDVLSQTVYNLPMLHQGGENLAITWHLSNSTKLNLQASKSRYLAGSTPLAQPLPTHDFTLRTLGAQLETTW